MTPKLTVTATNQSDALNAQQLETVLNSRVDQPSYNTKEQHMSMFIHDHSDEGFDDEWAQSMQPTWDELAAKRKATAEYNAVHDPDGAVQEAYQQYLYSLRANAISSMLSIMTADKEQ